MRVALGCSKFTTWTINVAFAMFTIQGPFFRFFVLFQEYTIGILCSLFGFCVVGWLKMRYFYPLFDLEINYVSRAFHEVVIDELNKRFKLRIKLEMFDPDNMLKNH